MNGNTTQNKNMERNSRVMCYTITQLCHRLHAPFAFVLQEIMYLLSESTRSACLYKYKFSLWRFCISHVADILALPLLVLVDIYSSCLFSSNMACQLLLWGTVVVLCEFQKHRRAVRSKHSVHDIRTCHYKSKITMPMFAWVAWTLFISMPCCHVYTEC